MATVRSVSRILDPVSQPKGGGAIYSQAKAQSLAARSKLLTLRELETVFKREAPRVSTFRDFTFVSGSENDIKIIRPQFLSNHAIGVVLTLDPGKMLCSSAVN
jgi:hypothetical protein